MVSLTELEQICKPSYKQLGPCDGPLLKLKPESFIVRFKMVVAVFCELQPAFCNYYL